jgi:class III poly(R)-hydroxyalkanoic acid synthase PhaE subunit
MNSHLSGNILNFSTLYESINPEMKKIRNQLLSIPNVGQNREIQDKLQKLIKLGIIYQEYNNEHQLVMAGLRQEALELMRKKILHMSKNGDEFTSMRQIYDLWIDSNEKEYGNYVLTKEYSELKGKLVNSQTAFMKLSHEVNEDILTAMNLPTTRAMNELERRHYELRKKVKALESELQTLKEKTVKKVNVAEIKPVVTKDKTVSATSNVTKKKKTARKKVAKKNVAKPTKHKSVRRAAKSAKKKATARRRSNHVKNDMIEIKF